MSKLAEWINTYKEKGAWWTHDGNPKRPHALLRSGKHSNGFCNSELVIQDPVLLDDACIDLAALYREEAYEIIPFFPEFTLCTSRGVNRVVGPAHGAIELSHDLARHISRKQHFPCLNSYTEKQKCGPFGTDTKMVFNRRSVMPDERVLLTEDVLTTGGSVELAVDAVVRAGGIVLPWVVVLVNRSGLTEVNGRKIIALIDYHMQDWLPDECPLCEMGSEAIRPKESVENWALLNASYEN